MTTLRPFFRYLFVLALFLPLAACNTSDTQTGSEPKSAHPEPVRSADWLAALPEGPVRRQIVLGCTPCHQLGPPIAIRHSLKDWREVITRMKKIDHDLDLALIPLDTEEIAQWLTANARMPEAGFSVPLAEADVRVYPAGPVTGFYHDMTVSHGRAWTADYFGNKLYGASIESGEVETYDLPVTVVPGKPAGAHQIDTTRDGMIWITFTKSEQVIRFNPITAEFRVYSGFERGANVQYFVIDADRYVYEDKEGGIWMTHFSREIISRLDPATGKITQFKTPRTQGMAEKAVHLYAAVADSHGRLWYTETHGNRFGVLDPNTGKLEEFPMPEEWSGPKRLAIDPDDVLWIPELATGRITRYDTRKREFLQSFSVPIPGDFPYAIRRNRYTGDFWITGSGSDSLYRVNPSDLSIKVYRLPHRGTYTRTVSFTETGIWSVYASFPNTHTQTPHQAGTMVRLQPK